MRLALALHAFPPRERTGVETYSEALARALALAGHQVEVFAPRLDRSGAHLSQLREEREGFGVTWLGLERDADHEADRRAIPGVARAFGRFLDREQPQLVHFQHVYKLGAALIEVARERDAAVVFTGHDPFPICNDYTLLAPDLTPVDPLDREALARCELARGVLDRHLAAHDGFLPVGEEDTELARRVRSLLHGDAAREREELEVRAARIDEEVTARLRLLERVDRIEVPTRYLAELYRAGGLEAEVEVRPCGIDTAALEGIAPIDAHRDGPLSVLYLGGYYEHKGVHVLLDAVGPLRESVRLVLRGCAGSSSYAARLEERARTIGAELGGRFDREELPALLREADLVVLPSLWPENAPFVIREAFAARRPVIASDTPALRESVRDRIDGRLFPAGDAGALRTILAELAQTRSRLVELASGIRPPLSIEEDARALVELYTPLVEARAEREQRRRERLPEHLREFAARHRELTLLPTREILARAQAGVRRIGARFGLEGAEPSPLAASTRLRERFAEARRASLWQEAVTADRERAISELRGRLQQAEERMAELERRSAWAEELLAEREARIEWQDEVIADRGRAVEAGEAELAAEGRRREALEARLEALEGQVGTLTTERDWLVEGRRENELRADWLERTLAGREEELSWTRGTVEDREARLEETERALRDTGSALEAVLAERGALLDERRGLLDEREALTADLDRRTGELAKLAADHQALGAHEEWLRGELARVLAPLFGTELTPEVATVGELCARALERLLALQRELSWRAAEMRAAAQEGRTRTQRWLGGALRRRVEGWPEGGPEEPER